LDIDGRPQFVKHPIGECKKVKIAAIDPDCVWGLCLGPWWNWLVGASSLRRALRPCPKAGWADPGL